jgi:hypothetical protein
MFPAVAIFEPAPSSSKQEGAGSNPNQGIENTAFFFIFLGDVFKNENHPANNT